MVSNINILSVYALAHESHETAKRSWRDFLGVISPILLECTADEVNLWTDETENLSSDDLINSLQKIESLKLNVKSLYNQDLSESSKIESDIARQDQNQFSPGVLFVLFSGEISFELGLEREFGIAAYLEPFQSTKVHKLVSLRGESNKNSKTRLQALHVGKWLKRFASFQHEDEFITIISEWKKIFSSFIEHPFTERSESSENLNENSEDIKKAS